MSVKLPDGFIKVPSEKKASITFDVPRRRFYLSTSLRRQYGIKEGDRLGLAYNPTDRQLCVDLNGRGFRVNKQGYVVSTYFVERAYTGSVSENDSPIKYVRSAEYQEFEKNGMVFFDET